MAIEPIRAADLRHVYARKALGQVPRLLGNLDRNPFSPTYGCFHRDYWLDKTSDFPDAVRQFAVHALALLYRYDFPGNIYRRQRKMREWTVAALDFWARIEHKDGSFDEFYPYERGWVGPTAFTTFAAAEALRLMRNDVPAEVGERVREAIRRAAFFIAAGEKEEDHLANHYAMACLAVWKAADVLGEVRLKDAYQELFRQFLEFHNSEEGWSREYDGVDPGYLSATVSFLAKVYQSHPEPRLLEVLKQSVEFCSYFVYPNGYYAGSVGSRNTLHFYPHGFEVLAGKIPMAAAVAQRMLEGLHAGTLVPPEIMSDRYLVYRIPEYLQAALDYTPRPAELPKLPYQREPFTRYFPAAGIYVNNRPRHYVVANLAKGGVVKVFDRERGNLRLNDCGLVGRLEDGRVVSSQWIGDYKRKAGDEGWEVSGAMHVVPSNKLFTLATNLLFRLTLLAAGWSSFFAHLLKGQIRKSLILGRRAAPVRFRREFRFRGENIEIRDQVEIEGAAVRFASLFVGDEFFVRHVPQSRYFQSQELPLTAYRLTAEELERLNRTRQAKVVTSLEAERQQPTVSSEC